MRLRTAAMATLLGFALAPSCAHGQGNVYTWNFSGSGTYSPSLINPGPYDFSSSGTLSIYYGEPNPTASVVGAISVTFDSPVIAPFPILYNLDTISATSSSTSFVGDFAGQIIDVSFNGNPGPLNAPGGIPVTLNAQLGQDGTFSILQNPISYGAPDTFNGALSPVPEPSSLLMLALGLGGVAIASCARRSRKPRGRIG
jgi:hypothetical protein